MFKKIWRWLKKLWQQLFSRSRIRRDDTPATANAGEKKTPRRSDAEYESLFLQLLDRVGEGASRDNIKGFLITKLIDEDELVAWLRRFGSNLLESPENHRELGRLMVQLGKVAGGELGDVAGEIGRELLGNSETRFLGETGFLNTSVIPTVDNQSADTTNSVSDDIPVDGEAEEWFNRGVDEYEAGNIQAALGCFQRAIEISPNDHYAWNGLGNALKNLGQYQQAIEAYQKAIEISPNFHDAWNGLGATLRDLGQYQEAIEAFQKAIEISPNFHVAWNGLGNALSDLGQYQEAIEAYQKAIDISPNYHVAWNGLGNALSELGQYQQAIEAYNRAIEISHNQSWAAWANRGLVINNLHGYQAALQNWDEGLRSLEPETRDYQEGCAVLHQCKGDAHYLYGKQQPNPHPYWRESRNSYITALKTLSGSQTSILGEVLREQVSPRFQLQYLEILQKLAKVCNALHYQDDFQLCLDIGDTMLENLLRQTDSQEWIIQLAKKFATFSQLRVVLLAQSSQPEKQIEALLLAEKRKNLCLRWMRDNLYGEAFDETPVQYADIQQLLNPQTCAVYWHYSPAAITTFIIKYDKLEVLFAEEPPSPDPIPRHGGRGVSEDGSDCITPFSQQTQTQETPTQTQTQPPTNSSITPLPDAGRGWGWGSSHSQTEPPSPDPIPRHGGRGERENESNFVTPFSQQTQTQETPTQTQTQPPKNSSLTPLPDAGRGWGWGSPAKQLQNFEDWLKDWKEDYKTNREKAKKEKGKERWRDEMENRLMELGKILDIETIINKIADDVTQLILIPHRDLHLLPLHYLFPEKFTITYLPSAKVGIQLQHSSPDGKKGVSSLPFQWESSKNVSEFPTPPADSEANPKSKIQNPKSPDIGAQLLSVEHPSDFMPYAAVESAKIAELFPHHRRYTTDATKDKVMELLRTSADIFHFTGHAYHNLDRPIESALLLANKTKLTLRDIFDLDTPSHALVCLSACETGLTGKEGLIDEFVGLVSGFLAKGATYVISTLWRVQEISTALLMIRFYQLLNESVPPAVALKQAQNWLRTVEYSTIIPLLRQFAVELESEAPHCSEFLEGTADRAEDKAGKMGLCDRPYAHPYYWAGFILSGKVQL
ncbi:CHAT domain-containing protein [Aerosakkonema funiforme]|uniref:CHAT domain-containing protein n=1 Tax=Aerosakkonema funiforme TaxID=1246630 RepID=UPI0035B934AA